MHRAGSNTVDQQHTEIVSYVHSVVCVYVRVYVRVLRRPPTIGAACSDNAVPEELTPPVRSAAL